MRILLNAANLHHGGGVAVASSVIHEVSEHSRAAQLTVVASTEVDANITALRCRKSRFERYEVFDQVGIRGLWRRLPFDARNFDQVINIFGPVYDVRTARGSVMGFAQPWIAFPQNPMARQLSRRQLLRTRLRHAVQSAFFALADTLVVEQDIVADALSTRRLLRRRRIKVIPNTVDPVFLTPELWDDVALPQNGSDLRLGLVSSNYPHKNLEVLPAVRRALRNAHGIRSTFFVTLPDNQWSTMSEDFRSETVNVGRLTLAQSASFTSQLDAVVLPTLLECFSATPLEASTLGVPLFASDIPAIRVPMGDYPRYIDPLDSGAIARTIAAWVAEGQPRQQPRRGGATHESRGSMLLALSEADGQDRTVAAALGDGAAMSVGGASE